MTGRDFRPASLTPSPLSLPHVASFDTRAFRLLPRDPSAPQAVVSARAGTAGSARRCAHDARHRGWRTAGARAAPRVSSCAPPPGLPDGPHHQRQRELLPHVQEDVPAQARPHGHQPRSPPRPRGLSPPVLTPLPQRIAAHVSSGTFLQSRQLTGRRGRGGRLWSH